MIQHSDPDPDSAATRIRAAQYIRMSTEHQQYSTENQRDAIADYAAKRNYEIVRTYADEGKSGLRIEGRAALRQLLLDVQEARADFAAILVLDVSRWGRFQDADESAYYEYCCKRAGIAVHYCSEQFENDGGPVATIVKSVKRTMAGEYSRELSSKVFQGQCRFIELGYRQGGPAGFGLRRMLVDQAGVPKAILARGEQKSLQTDRVILVPGPDKEVALVREMYDWFVRQDKSEAEIAELLNERRITTDLQRAWTPACVHQVLTNEKYIGNNVFNRISFKLKRKRIRNEPEMWIRADHAFASIVSEADFTAARTIIERRRRRLSDTEMLTLLRDLVARCSQLSARLIDEAPDMPTSSSYRSRFGSLIQAYRYAGYVPTRDYEYVEINRNLRQLYPQLVEDVIRRLDSVGATVTRDASTDLLLINGEYSCVDGAVAMPSDDRRLPAVAHQNR